MVKIFTLTHLSFRGTGEKIFLISIFSLISFLSTKFYANYDNATIYKFCFLFYLESLPPPFEGSDRNKNSKFSIFFMLYLIGLQTMAGGPHPSPHNFILPAKQIPVWWLWKNNYRTTAIAKLFNNNTVCFLTPHTGIFSRRIYFH